VKPCSGGCQDIYVEEPKKGEKKLWIKRKTIPKPKACSVNCLGFSRDQKNNTEGREIKTRKKGLPNRLGWGGGVVWAFINHRKPFFAHERHMWNTNGVKVEDLQQLKGYTAGSRVYGGRGTK